MKHFHPETWENHDPILTDDIFSHGLVQPTEAQIRVVTTFGEEIATLAATIHRKKRQVFFFGGDGLLELLRNWIWCVLEANICRCAQ